MGRAHRHIAPAKNPYISSGLNVIIPAAGIGKRMKSRGPLCLFRIRQSMSILEYQIKIIKKIVPEAEIIVVVGFESQKIKDEIWGLARIVYNPQYETTNTMYSVGLGLDAALPKPTMIIHGDVVFNACAIHALYDKPGSSSVLIDVNHEIEHDKVGVIQHENEITNFSHGLPKKWSQMVYLAGKEFQLFRKLASKQESHRLFTYEVLNQVIDSGGHFAAQQSRDAHVREINRYKDLLKAKKT